MSQATPIAVAARPEKGAGVVARIAAPVASFSLRYVPDPLVLTLMLTAIAYVAALWVTHVGWTKAIALWANGWMSPGILTFTAQACIGFIAGYAVVTAPASRRLFNRLADLPKTPTQAIVAVTLAGLTLSYLNWAFGIVMSGLYARKVGARVKGVHFPLLIAAAFSGYNVWMVGISGIVPQLVATHGHPLQKVMGVIPVTQTLFSPINLILVLAMFITTPILNALMHPPAKHVIEMPEEQAALVREEDADTGERHDEKEKTFSLAMNNSRLIGLILGFFGVVSLFSFFRTQGFNLNINVVNLLFLTLAVLLIQRPISIARTLARGTALTVAPLLLQFPLYGGIAGLMGTGLGKAIVGWISQWATSYTLPVFTFFGTGLLHILVPSGGGLWIVEGPIVAGSANALHSSQALNVLAYAWGDNLTNMFQPFWALAILSMAGLEARHMVGYTAIVGVWMAVVVSAGLLILPKFF